MSESTQNYGATVEEQVQSLGETVVDNDLSKHGIKTILQNETLRGRKERRVYEVFVFECPKSTCEDTSHEGVLDCRYPHPETLRIDASSLTAKGTVLQLPTTKQRMTQRYQTGNEYQVRIDRKTKSGDYIAYPKRNRDVDEKSDGIHLKEGEYGPVYLIEVVERSREM